MARSWPDVAPPSALRDEAIYVVGAGAQTAVGRSVLAAAAAVRCGVSAYAEHPFMIDRHGEPMVVARAEWLDEGLPPDERIAALAVDAAREALHPLGPRVGSVHRHLRVHLALAAESVPDPAVRRRIAAGLAAGVGLSPSHAAADVVAEGHAGGLLALARAVDALRRGDAQLCLVGGADSWLEPERLESLDRAGRLHSVNGSWGLTPGEGAAFCLVASGAAARRLGLRPYAELLAVACAAEPKLQGTRTVCIGEGLTAAFRGVLDPRQRVAHGYCDFNGETYRADEYGFTVCRTSECFEDAGSFTAPAECAGDVGAASAPLAIALSVAAWARGYAKGDVQLAWGSSATLPLRGAALLRRPAAGAA